MKNRYAYLLICFLLIAPFMLRAQITADSVPPGMFAVNPNITLSVAPCVTLDSATFDINCDGNPDMMLKLYKGAVIVDGANWCYLVILNDSFEIIKDTAGMFSGYFGRPHYFNAGDALVPP